MTSLLTEGARVLATGLEEELKRSKGERLQKAVLRYLASNADALAGITLAKWAWVCEKLENEGLEGVELARHCQLLMEGINGSLAGYENLMALVLASDLSPEDAGLQDLEARLPALREAPPQVAQTLEMATRTPPIDETKLSASRAALDRGEFVAIDDAYLDRLRAGGEF